MENETNNTIVNNTNETTSMNNTSIQTPVYTNKTYKKGNSGLIVFLIILVIALLGVIGYFLYDKYVKNSIVEDKPNTNEPTKVGPTLNYDQTKTITIDGKEYLIGLIKTNKQREDMDGIINTRGTVLIYLNNVEINTGTYNSYSNSTDNDNANINAYAFGQNYILIAFSINTPSGEVINFYAYDLNGTYIGGTSYDGRVVIKEKATDTRLTYEISDDKLAIYRPIYDLNTASKVSYTILDNVWGETTIKTYAREDVEVTGK